VSDSLVIALMAAVPIRIELLRRQGGPGPDDWDKATAFGAVLAEKGDVLMFGSKKKGEAADLFNGLAHALACMAFLPGGVVAFGQHWEAKPPDEPR
jgi:hypothetical protein